MIIKISWCFMTHHALGKMMLLLSYLNVLLRLAAAGEDGFLLREEMGMISFSILTVAKRRNQIKKNKGFGERR